MARRPRRSRAAWRAATLAPPAFAPIAPSRARKRSEAADTARTSKIGRRHDHHQQRQGGADGEGRGRGQRRLDRPRGGHLGNAEFVARVGAKRILGHQLVGDLARQRRRRRPRGDVDLRQLLPFEFRLDLAVPCVSRARSACSVSDCELTETYSPAAIDMAPATSPAMPATRTSDCAPPRPPRRRRSGWPSRRCRHWRRARPPAASRCARRDGFPGASEAGS